MNASAALEVHGLIPFLVSARLVTNVISNKRKKKQTTNYKAGSVIIWTTVAHARSFIGVLRPGLPSVHHFVSIRDQ